MSFVFTPTLYRVVLTHDGEPLKEPPKFSVAGVATAVKAARSASGVTDDLDFDTPIAVSWGDANGASGNVHTSVQVYRKTVAAATLRMLRASHLDTGEALKRALKRALPTLKTCPVVVDTTAREVWILNGRAKTAQQAEAAIEAVLSAASKCNTAKTGRRVVLVKHSLAEYLRETRPHASLPARIEQRFLRWLYARCATEQWLHHPELGRFTVRATGAVSAAAGHERQVIGRAETGASLPAVAEHLTVHAMEVQVSDVSTGAEWTLVLDSAADVAKAKRDNPTEHFVASIDAGPIQRMLRMLWRVYDDEVITELLAATPCLFTGMPEGGVELGRRPDDAVGELFKPRGTT